jgi:hypothetical protein
MIAQVFQRYTATSTLWILFVSTVLITASFLVVAPMWDLRLLDSISDPDEVRTVLAGMSDTQKSAHAWITATLDVAYPLIYGTFFGAVALHFFPRHQWMALPALLVIPVDLLEGIVQVSALLGMADWVDAKAVLTPLKMWLFYAALAVSVAGWALWIYRRVAGDDG